MGKGSFSTSSIAKTFQANLTESAMENDKDKSEGLTRALFEFLNRRPIVDKNLVILLIAHRFRWLSRSDNGKKRWKITNSICLSVVLLEVSITKERSVLTD